MYVEVQSSKHTLIGNHLNCPQLYSSSFFCFSDKNKSVLWILIFVIFNQIFCIVQLNDNFTHALKLAEITHHEHYLVKQDCALCAIFWRQNSKLFFFKCIHRAKDFHCNSSQADRCGRVIRYILTSSKENFACCCSVIAPKITRDYKVD